MGPPREFGTCHCSWRREESGFRLWRILTSSKHQHEPSGPARLPGFVVKAEQGCPGSHDRAVELRRTVRHPRSNVGETLESRRDIVSATEDTATFLGRQGVMGEFWEAPPRVRGGTVKESPRSPQAARGMGAQETWSQPGKLQSGKGPLCSAPGLSLAPAHFRVPWGLGGGGTGACTGSCTFPTDPCSGVAPGNLACCPVFPELDIVVSGLCVSSLSEVGGRWPSEGPPFSVVVPHLHGS